MNAAPPSDSARTSRLAIGRSIRLRGEAATAVATGWSATVTLLATAVVVGVSLAGSALIVLAAGAARRMAPRSRREALPTAESAAPGREAVATLAPAQASLPRR